MSKRASDPETPVKGGKAAKKGQFGSRMASTALPDQGFGGWDEVFNVEGRVISVKPGKEGSASVQVSSGTRRAWVWLSKAQLTAVGVGLVLGSRVAVEGASFFEVGNGLEKLGLTPRKGSGRPVGTLKLLAETPLSPLSDFVETPADKTKEHHILGLVGGKVGDGKREYVMLWNKKTAVSETKAVLVVSYFPFPPEVQVGAVVTCGPVVALEAGRVRASGGFKMAVHVPGVSITASATAFLKLHDTEYLSSETAQSALEYMATWGNGLAVVETVEEVEEQEQEEQEEEQEASVEVDVEAVL